MSFANPLALLLLLGALPIVVLYLLKVRRRRVEVAYLRLWESLLVETRTRSLFHRLKRWLSLLLQLLILLALSFALAQPTLELGSTEEEHIVVLLDTSASMQAMEKSAAAGQSAKRFDLMLTEARRLVEERSPEDAMMIVAVSDRIDVLCPFNRNKLLLRAALDEARPGHRSLDAERALAFAREVSQDKSSPRILFLTDGAAGQVKASLREDEIADGRARILPIGGEAENVGIVRFSARKNTSLGTDYVLAMVRNYGQSEQRFTMELSLNSVTQKVLPRVLAGGASLSEKFQLTLPEGGTLRLSVDPDDALAVDDVAYAIVRPNRRRRVVLVTPAREQALPFRIAFESMREVIDPASMAVTAEEYASLSADERRADVTICLGAAPAGLPADGNLILIDADPPSFLPAEQTGREAKPSVWDWDREHILNRYLNYRDLPLPAARTISLQPGPGITELVNSYESPLVAAFDLPSRRVVYVAFNMTASLFPFRLAFPMLLRNAIAWFELSEDVLFEETYRPGEVISPLRRVAASEVQASFFRGGEREEVSLPLSSGRFYFVETEEPGPYLFRVGDSQYATCVNLFDPSESAIAPEEPDVQPFSLAGGVRSFDRDLWPWLLLLGLVLWALEWATYHRRVTE